MKERNEKLSLLSELIKMANIDDKMREIEYSFLLSVSAQLGITNDDFSKLFNKYISFHPPKLEFDRILQFQRLILLMSVDLEIHEEELRLIRDLGLRMGLNPTATESVLSEMNNYSNNIVPPDRLLEVFRTFHN